ncbi:MULTISPECIES: hypothetical protein [Prauserella]|uniref:IPTL-CTERM protein sorting domain-containing protein n=1 Tax=Prauserella endophytica TaxID=1592324 RepID=A0ABY2SAK6_9PSEU|nr:MULTISPECIES: hypothetical protein [Prauserella]TKG72662.1 hypothetical protein FCN18_05325 [Prauserella endophytica]
MTIGNADHDAQGMPCGSVFSRTDPPSGFLDYPALRSSALSTPQEFTYLLIGAALVALIAGLTVSRERQS